MSHLPPTYFYEFIKSWLTNVSVPVKPGCCLLICARLRSVLLVSICLTVFRILLIPAQGTN